MKSSYPSNLKFNLKGKEFVKITFLLTEFCQMSELQPRAFINTLKAKKDLSKAREYYVGLPNREDFKDTDSMYIPMAKKRLLEL